MTLGENILKARENQNLSQKELANIVGVSTGTIALWESDEISPSLSEIATLSKALHITTNQLIVDVEVNESTNQKTTDAPYVRQCTRKGGNKNLRAFIFTSFVLVVLLSVVGFCFKDYIFIPSAEKIYNLVAPSTVEITANSIGYTNTGSGFFIDDKGTVITNFHVIENCFAASISLYDGTKHPVSEVLGYSKELDIAILATGCACSIPLEFRENPVSTGEKAYTLGSSLGLTGTFAVGNISSATRKISGKNFIQTTAPISSGNSGGPLIDKSGKVIGVTTAGFDDGQNLNLAVPIILAANIDKDDNISMEDLFLQKHNIKNSFVALIIKHSIDLYLEKPTKENEKQLLEELNEYSSQ